MLPLLGKEDPEALAVAVRSDLVDIAPEMPRSDQPVFTHVLHGGGDRCCVDIRESIEELLDGTPAPLDLVVPPAPFDPEWWLASFSPITLQIFLAATSVAWPVRDAESVHSDGQPW